MIKEVSGEFNIVENKVPDEWMFPYRDPDNDGLLFTHTDADGIGCAILMSFSRIKYDIIFAGNNTIDGKIMAYINSAMAGFTKIYHNILITDISVGNDTAQKLQDFCEANDINLLLVDHHATNKMPEKFPWAFVSTTDFQMKYESATETWSIRYNIADRPPISAAGLLSSISSYDYNDDELNFIGKAYNPNMKDGIMSIAMYETFEDQFDYINEMLDNYAEEISRYDTWEWKRNPRDYRENRTAILLEFFNLEETYDRLIGNMVNKHTVFTENEQAFFDVYNQKVSNLVQSCDNSMVFVDMDEYHVGMIFATDYYSEVANKLCEMHPEIDFILGIYPESMQVSLRSVRTDLNLGRFCKKKWSGGGHPQAAGASFSDYDTFKTDILWHYYNALETKRRRMRATESNRKAEEERAKMEQMMSSQYAKSSDLLKVDGLEFNEESVDESKSMVEEMSQEDIKEVMSQADVMAREYMEEKMEGYNRLPKYFYDITRAFLADIYGTMFEMQSDEIENDETIDMYYYQAIHTLNYKNDKEYKDLETNTDKFTFLWTYFFTSIINPFITEIKTDNGEIPDDGAKDIVKLWNTMIDMITSFDTIPDSYKEMFKNIKEQYADYLKVLKYVNDMRVNFGD